MRTPAALERVAYEFAVDNYSEGVRYFEVRFAPQLHSSQAMDIPKVLEAVNAGLSRAKREFNDRLFDDEQYSGEEPAYEYGIIACAMRGFDENTSSYYGELCRSHKHQAPEEVAQLASSALVAAVV